jgi:hypothetical protein
VSIPHPDKNASSWEMKLFAAWVALHEISGHISEKLYFWSRQSFTKSIVLTLQSGTPIDVFRMISTST